MKRISWLLMLGILFVACLVSTVAIGQEDIPTVILPVTNYTEVRKDFIRAEGNAFPGGWGGYYANYKNETGHMLEGRRAGPFDAVMVFPFPLEMWWVEVLMYQDRDLESDQWAEMAYSLFDQIYSDTMSFQIGLFSDSLGLLGHLSQEDLRFIYQDSTGARRNGQVEYYTLNERKKPIYVVQVGVGVPLGDKPEDITWFSLHVMTAGYADSVDMRWEFQKD